MQTTNICMCGCVCFRVYALVFALSSHNEIHIFTFIVNDNHHHHHHRRHHHVAWFTMRPHTRCNIPQCEVQVNPTHSHGSGCPADAPDNSNNLWPSTGDRQFVADCWRTESTFRVAVRLPGSRLHSIFKNSSASFASACQPKICCICLFIYESSKWLIGLGWYSC